MIKLPIYYDTPESQQKELMGIDIENDDLITREAVFFNINAVSKNNSGVTVIHCNGDTFACSLSYEEVIKKIGPCGYTPL